MKRRSKKWWRAAATSLMAFTALNAAAQTDQSLGLALGEDFHRRYSTPQILREEFANPLLSDKTNMATLDGAASFNVQMMFPSSQRFLEIFAQPGASGDLTTVIVGQDLDFSGQLDFSFQVPFAISGVCANGVISCIPGTWEDCLFYLWRTQGDGRLFLQPAQVFDLGGCYCLNNACGNGLVWQNLPLVLKDLGGGAVGALQREHPNYAVSQVEVQESLIAYFGQDRTRPAAQAAPDPAPNVLPQTRYFGNASLVLEDLNTTVVNQVGDPLSFHQLIAGLADAAVQGEKRTCVLRRVIQVSEVNDLCSDPLPQQILPPVIEDIDDEGICRRNYDIYRDVVTDTCRSFEDNPLCRLEQEVVDGVRTYQQFNPTGLFPLPEGRYVPGSFFYLNTPLWEMTVGWENISASTTQRFSDLLQGDTLVFSIVKIAHTTPSGCQHTVVSLNVETEDGTLIGQGWDGGAYTICWNIGDPYFVYPYTVPIDGTHTFKISGGGYDPGKHSLNTAFRVRLIRDSRRGETFIRPWWNKDRIYLCEQTSGFDFEDMKKRMAHVVSNTEETASELAYQDLTRDPDGNWSESLHSANLPAAVDLNECEPVCKTRRPRTDAQISVAGPVAGPRVDPQSWEFFYHPCRDERCPTGPGEEILQDCQCLNEFAESATILQTLRMAARDQVCSDGAAKSLP